MNYENENKKDNFKLTIEYVNEDSDNSIDENIFHTARYISLKDNGISVEKLKSNNKITKKNTRVSSNVEEVEDSENENDNKSINLNIHITDNLKHSNDNNNDNNNNYENNNYNSSDNLVISHRKNKYLYSNNLNMNDNDNNNDNNDKCDKINNSLNNIINKKEYLYKVNHTNDDKDNLYKRSSFSPSKKRKKFVLEEKKKNRGPRKSIYTIEHKEEVKEDEKKYRKDKNGTEICKKNKKKVKIGFEEPLVNIIPIESFKRYNIMLGLPKEEKYYNGRDDCRCCLIM